MFNLELTAMKRLVEPIGAHVQPGHGFLRQNLELLLRRQRREQRGEPRGERQGAVEPCALPWRIDGARRGGGGGEGRSDEHQQHTERQRRRDGESGHS